MNSPASSELQDSPFTPPPQAFPESEGIDLRGVVATILDSWILVLGAAALAGMVGLYTSLKAPPFYSAFTLVELVSKSSGYVLGGSEMPGSFVDPNMMGPQPTINQIELIKSRSILTEAVKEAGLDLEVWPLRFPEIGSAWAFRHGDATLAGVPLFLPQLEKYAWGGERISVLDFQIPDNLRGTIFRLVAGSPGLYDLYLEDASIIKGAKVGETATGIVGKDPVALAVADLRAREGTVFFISRSSLPAAAAALRGALAIKERGAGGYLGGSGILELTVTAGTPDYAERAANAIATAYLKWNVRNLSEEATKKLEFLNQQLPRLQTDVRASEEALLEHKLRSGNLQLTQASQSVLEDYVSLEKKLNDLQLQRAELSQSYTTEHPLMQSLQRKQDALLAERNALNQRLSRLPESEQKLLQLTRDSQVANQLYVALLNKAQEIRLVQAGTVGNVRIVDDALRPNVPSGPDRRGILLKWLFGGLVLGIVLAFVKKQVSITAHTPDELEHKFGVPIYATVPHSDSQRATSTKRGRDKLMDAGGGRLLAQNDPTDPAIESIRSLRAALHFALMGTKSNLVALSGPAPSVGKSFIAGNLAWVAASAGQRVLLIDGDLRRGHLHDVLGLTRGPGLSEYLSRQGELDTCVRQVDEKFSVLTTGRVPPNPAELLASARFHELLEHARGKYDLVIADSPPVMNLADAILIARNAGAVFVVVRGGESSVGEVRDSIKRFINNQIRVDGLVFNDFKPKLSGYLRGSYGNYYYYNKYRRYA